MDAFRMAALDVHALNRGSQSEMVVPSCRRASTLPPEPCGHRELVAATGPCAPRAGAGAITPACRLRLEGRGAREGACEILELSAEGVTIALKAGWAARPGQHGSLLIGPAGGGHYILPVAVRWVKPSPTTSVVGLALPASERWIYSRAVAS